jgi:hypothetical protein
LRRRAWQTLDDDDRSGSETVEDLTHQMLTGFEVWPAASDRRIHADGKGWRRRKRDELDLAPHRVQVILVHGTCRTAPQRLAELAAEESSNGECLPVQDRRTGQQLSRDP